MGRMLSSCPFKSRMAENPSPLSLQREASPSLSRTVCASLPRRRSKILNDCVECGGDGRFEWWIETFDERRKSLAKLSHLGPTQFSGFYPPRNCVIAFPEIATFLEYFNLCQARGRPPCAARWNRAQVDERFTHRDGVGNHDLRQHESTTIGERKRLILIKRSCMLQHCQASQCGQQQFSRPQALGSTMEQFT